MLKARWCYAGADETTTVTSATFTTNNSSVYNCKFAVVDRVTYVVDQLGFNA